MIPADKNNRYTLMSIDEYVSEMEYVLCKTLRSLDIKNIRKYQKDTLTLLENSTLLLSSKEY